MFKCPNRIYFDLKTAKSIHLKTLVCFFCSLDENSLVMDIFQPYVISSRFAKFVQLDKYTDILGSCVIHKLVLEFLSEESKKQAAEIEKELFHLQLQQNSIVRRQSELVYTLEDLWLREQSLDINRQLNVIASKTEYDLNLNSPIDEEEKIEKLMTSLILLVEERDKMLQDLDIERLREHEEDLEIKEEIHFKRLFWSPSNDLCRSTSDLDQFEDTSKMESKSQWSRHLLDANGSKIKTLKSKLDLKQTKDNCTVS